MPSGHHANNVGRIVERDILSIRMGWRPLGERVSLVDYEHIGMSLVQRKVTIWHKEGRREQREFAWFLDSISYF
jgi:hypothetical protein